MTNDQHRYHPRQVDEIEDAGVSLLNEPVAPDNAALLVQPKPRPIHAMLVESP